MTPDQTPPPQVSRARIGLASALALTIAAGAAWFALRPRYALAEILDELGRGIEQFHAALERCERECPSEEAEVARAVHRDLGSGGAKPSDGAAASEALLAAAMKSLVRSGIDVYERRGDGARVARFYSEGIGAMDSLRGLGLPDPEFERAIREGIRALPERYPGLADARALRVELLEHDNASDAEAFPALRSCLELGKAPAYCRTRYQARVDRYRSPGCDTNGLAPSLELRYEASDEGGQGSTEIELDGHETWLAPGSVPGRVAFERIALGPKDEGTGRRVLQFLFRPDGLAALNQLGGGPRPGRRLFILSEGRVLMAPILRERFSSPRMDLSMGTDLSAEEALRGYCRDATPRELPAEWRI